MKVADCGRLPGVVASSCSSSRCIITKCRDGWRLNANHSGCINNAMDHTSSEKIKRASVHPRLEDLALTARGAVVLDSDLWARTSVLVDLVVVLGNDSPPTLPTAPHNCPPMTRTEPRPALTAVDSGLVQCIVEATAKLLHSATVADFIVNLDALVDINAVVINTLRTCGCVQHLGLGELLDNVNAVVKTALEIQNWCLLHPIGAPAPHPSTVPLPHTTVAPQPSSSPAPSQPVTVPNESNGAIVVGLDPLLNSLTLGFLNSKINIDGLVSPELAGAANNLLDGIGIGPSGVSANHGNAPIVADVLVKANTNIAVEATLKAQISDLANLVLVLKNSSSVLPAPHNGPGSHPTSPENTLPVDKNLVDAVVRATIKLLSVDTVSALQLSLDALVDVTALINTSLLGCGCVNELGLDGLLLDVQNLLAAVLNVQRWCADHPIIPPTPSASLPAPHASATNMPRPPSHAGDLHINLGLDDLLAALGLNLNSEVDALVDLNGLVNTLVGVVVSIQGHSSPLPPNPSPAPHPSAPYPSGTPSTPITYGLVDAVVQATLNLVHSLTVAEVLANANILLGTSTTLLDALDHCGCVSRLGLGSLVSDVDKLLDILLKLNVWCREHPEVKGSGTGTGVGGIIINAQPLLKSLGLADVVQVEGVVNGLDGQVNPILKGLGLGGLRRWIAAS
ncbi:hypothetical protein H0H81_005048 [Sphagnurus paluster]|uniref:Protein CPL1-like domain-containing protein n=1 Tax=Sphagnurus paluster TaxID=117069 RepID=A0A9P7K5W9_9AGAR|nr:hypothetical protein H0H81_005048 [Sphagnurus paluster]